MLHGYSTSSPRFNVGCIPAGAGTHMYLARSTWQCSLMTQNGQLSLANPCLIWHTLNLLPNNRPFLSPCLTSRRIVKNASRVGRRHGSTGGSRMVWNHCEFQGLLCKSIYLLLWPRGANTVRLSGYKCRLYSKFLPPRPGRNRHTRTRSTCRTIETNYVVRVIYTFDECRSQCRGA